MESTEKAEYLEKERSCNWQITNGRDSEAVRIRFTTQRKHPEFLGYKRILFVCREYKIGSFNKGGSKS